MLRSFLVHLFHYHPPLFQPRLPVLLFSPADRRALLALDVSTPKNHRLTATGHQTECRETPILLSMPPHSQTPERLRAGHRQTATPAADVLFSLLTSWSTAVTWSGPAPHIQPPSISRRPPLSPTKPRTATNRRQRPPPVTPQLCN